MKKKYKEITLPEDTTFPDGTEYKKGVKIMVPVKEANEAVGWWEDEQDGTMKIDNLESFMIFLKLGGWDTMDAWLADTSVTFDEIKGKPFVVIRGSVSIVDEDDFNGAWISHEELIDMYGDMLESTDEQKKKFGRIKEEIFEVAEDFEIPGTDIWLEKGDKFKIVGTELEEATYSEVRKMIDVVRGQLGDYPGNMFYGDVDAAEMFDTLWENGDGTFAIWMLLGTPDLDITDAKSLKAFLDRQ